MAPIPCPHCSQHLQLPDKAAGKTIRCPKCQQTFQAPAAEPAKVEAITASEPAPATQPDAAMTEKALAPTPRWSPEDELPERPRRDRRDAAAGSSMTLVVLLILGAAGLSVCGCSVAAMMGGFVTFFAAARDVQVQEQVAVAHAHEEADKAFVLEKRAKALAEKARADDLDREKQAEVEVMKRKEVEEFLKNKEEAEFLKKRKDDEILKKELAEKPEHGEVRRLQIPENRGDVRALSFTADGNKLLAATKAESVHSWDLTAWEVKTNTLEGVVKGFGDRQIGAAAFTPKGDKVYFGKHGGALSWHDLTKEPAPRTTIQIGDPGRGFAFNHIALSPDGLRVCTSHGDSVAFVWALFTQAKENTLKDFQNQVGSGAFHPKKNIIAAGAQDVQVFEPALSKRTHLKGAGPYVFRSLQFSRDGQFLTGVNGPTLYHWNLDDAKPEPSKVTYDQNAQHLAYSPDGNTLAVAVHLTRIYFYDAPQLKYRFMIDMKNDSGNFDTPHAIAFHPDNRRFAVARGPRIYVFDLANFEKGK